MKHITVITALSAALLFSCGPKKPAAREESSPVIKAKHLYLDVHSFQPGKVTFEGVAEAHKKDLETQSKYDAKFLKYWVDEKGGKVYCLVEAPDSAAVYNTHKDAHGLVPDLVQLVTDGVQAAAHGNATLFLDIHELGPGKVTAADVAGAHQKDLAVQDKFDVNFLNYWVDEKSGRVICLCEAKDSMSVMKTHKEAHGLMPQEIHKVQQGE